MRQTKTKRAVETVPCTGGCLDCRDYDAEGPHQFPPGTEFPKDNPHLARPSNPPDLVRCRQLGKMVQVRNLCDQFRPEEPRFRRALEVVRVV
jgi:hypothetical protein